MSVTTRQTFAVAAMMGACVFVACATRPTIAANGPVRPTFAAPAGLRQSIEAREERWVKVPTDKGVFEQTVVEQATTDESYEALPRGGYAVTRTLVDDSWWVDEQPRAPAFSQAGLSLRFTIDGEGHFVEVINADDYIQALEARSIDSTQLKLLQSRLTAEAVAAPVKAAWESQLDSVCGQQLSPGDAFFRLDETSVTAAREVPIRALKRETMVGSGHDGLTPVVELKLDFGGAESLFTQSDAARAFRSALPLETRVLTPKLEGTGSRLVSLSNCVTLRESSEMTGTVALPDEASSVERVLQFRVRRTYTRTSPSGAL